MVWSLLRCFDRAELAVIWIGLCWQVQPGVPAVLLLAAVVARARLRAVLSAAAGRQRRRRRRQASLTCHRPAAWYSYIVSSQGMRRRGLWSTCSAPRTAPATCPPRRWKRSALPSPSPLRLLILRCVVAAACAQLWERLHLDGHEMKQYIDRISVQQPSE